MSYRVPTCHELRSCLEMVARFCGLTWGDLAFRMGISKQWMSNLVTKGKPIRSATARDIREKVLSVIDTELDPFYCPSAGLEREWFDACQSIKTLLRAEIDRVIPEPPDFLKQPQKKVRPRYVK